MLDRILPLLPKQKNENLLVGLDTLDDAGVYRLRDDLALVQTVDFFTPIVDNAFDYGRIAAANSLSDVYAMGGTPVTALNIVAFPDGKLPDEVLADILRGSAGVCTEAGVTVVGGHSVSDEELKFGLAVTGVLDPREKVLSNAGACAGDVLLLTKPLGTGLISNAMMNDAANGLHVQEMVDSMVRLNKVAAEAARAGGANAATDITGFGLLGHGMEMAKASGVTLELSASALPMLEGAWRIATSGSFYSGGERRNLAFVEKSAAIGEEVSEGHRRIASDPQTSGGLLLSVPESRVEAVQVWMRERGETAWRIGLVRERGPAAVVLAP